MLSSNNFKINDRVVVSGDSSELWIKEYNVRVSTEATVVQTPDKYSKKILLTLDSIDGDRNVCCWVRKSKVKLLPRYVVRVYTEDYSFENYDDYIYRADEKDVNANDVKVQKSANSKEELTTLWQQMLVAWEGYTYSVKDVINDEIIIGGVFDPNDIDYINEYFIPQNLTNVILVSLDEHGKEKREIIKLCASKEEAEDYVAEHEQEFSDNPAVFCIEIEEANYE